MPTNREWITNRFTYAVDDARGNIPRAVRDWLNTNRTAATNEDEHCPTDVLGFIAGHFAGTEDNGNVNNPVDTPIEARFVGAGVRTLVGLTGLMQARGGRAEAAGPPHEQRSR